MHDLRLGIWTPTGLAWETLREYWRMIEQIGFDGAGLIDHFMPTAGDEDGPIFEGWTTLAALAALTPRLRVAVLVSGNTYRNPVLLAKQAVSLDHITGGRLDLGIGAGWYEREHDAYGFRLPPPGERVDMLRESVQIIKNLMHGGRTTFSGTFYQLEDAPFSPLPVQPGGIPLMIAAKGRRMLRLVAEYADIWNVNHSPAKMHEFGAILDDHCTAIGRDPALIRRAAFTVPAFLGYDPFESVDRFRDAVREYTDAGASEIHFRMPRPDQFDVLERAAAILPDLRAEHVNQ